MVWENGSKTILSSTLEAQKWSWSRQKWRHRGNSVTKLGLACCRNREGMTLEAWTAMITTSIVLEMQQRQPHQRAEGPNSIFLAYFSKNLRLWLWAPKAARIVSVIFHFKMPGVLHLTDMPRKHWLFRDMVFFCLFVCLSVFNCISYSRSKTSVTSKNTGEIKRK